MYTNEGITKSTSNNSLEKLQKIHINHDHTATFTCPKCNNSKITNVSKFMETDKIVKANMRCPCGYHYKALLDKRRYYRKSVQFNGTYTKIIGGKPLDKGPIKVDGLSRTGLSGDIHLHGGIEVGQKLIIEFTLDNQQSTHISKESKVITIHGDKIGVEFLSSLEESDEQDKALGFYLLKIK